jgi:outer membrane protein assembly factor BamB
MMTAIRRATRRPATFALALLATAALALPAAAADWPMFRGPGASGISPETGLLTKFPSGGPKLVWSSDKVGLGYSSFAVVGDRLYTMGQEGDEEFVVALDAKSGERLWKQAIGEGYENNFGGGPRCTPTLDGDALYVLSA